MKWLSIPLFILAFIVLAQEPEGEKPDYKLKQRVETADVIVTGKMLYVGCFDEDFVEHKPRGNCTGPDKKRKLKYDLRTDDVLKGRNTFLKEHNLRQKVFFYSKIDIEREAKIKGPEHKVFFFKTRDLEPVLIDSVNYVPISERAEIERLIKEN